MNPFDLLHRAGAKLDVFERYLAVFECDATAEGIRQSARLIMNLFEHEVRIAALLRRHRVPGAFFNRPTNRFALAVEYSIGAVNLAQGAPHRVEKIDAAGNFFGD